MLKKITSLSNSKIIEYSKLDTKKARCETGLFSAEGEKCLEDILKSDIKIEDIFVTENYDKIDNLPQEKVTIVSDAVMEKLSSSASKPKVLTLAHQKFSCIQDFGKNGKRLLLLDGISDPGNMGTLIRLAVAFKFQGILLVNNCVDLYNPKVIRSAAGNFFKIDFAQVDNISALKKMQGYQYIMADIHDKNYTTPEAVVLNKSFIFVLGSEANGISQEILTIPHLSVKIDMIETVESLNVATAGAIIMYEFAKKI